MILKSLETAETAAYNALVRRKNACRIQIKPVSLNIFTHERKVDMIKIMLISDMDKFIEKVENCRGDVMLSLPDGSECNLKTDHAARQIVKMLHSDNEELSLRLTDPGDCAAIMRFMMQPAA